MLDKEYFFSCYDSLTETQKHGIEYIIDTFEADPELTNYKWLAYALATVKHECANTWLPITERGPKSYFKYLIGKLGNSNFEMAYKYRGRGYVQLTGYTNYRNMGAILGVNLKENPDLALQPDLAAKIMFYGMLNGTFTGRRFESYFNDHVTDPVNARRIINGKDKAQLIAGYYEKIFKCFKLKDAV